MPHLPERSEKVCLNCKADLIGRFCHICGQENVEPKEGFWHMVTHFVFDLFHFDGKFLSTLKYLLFKPGYLSKEHLIGKRASYLHPIRMYVFTSAFFFLIFFNFFQKGEKEINGPNRAEQAKNELQNSKKEVLQVLKMTSVIKNSKLTDSLRKKLTTIEDDINLLNRDTANFIKLKTLESDNANNINIKIDDKDIQLTSLRVYDSIQQSLPNDKKDGFFLKIWKWQIIALKESHHNNSKELGKAIIERFVHMYPQVMFSSLPLVSLILLLLYIRRKNFYYADHLVFTIHFICASFIYILFGLVIDKMYHTVIGRDIPFFTIIMLFLLVYYLFRAMYNFYGQSISKTILKTCILIVINFISVIPLVFGLFIIISIFTTH